MYSTIRKLRKNKLFRYFKIFLTSVFLIILFTFFSFFVITNFLRIDPLIISPLAKEKATDAYQIGLMLKNANILYSSIKINRDKSYIIKLKDNGEVIISNKKQWKEQISSLQLILSRLTIEGKRFKSLDFRFDKPVLVF